MIRIMGEIDSEGVVLKVSHAFSILNEGFTLSFKAKQLRNVLGRVSRRNEKFKINLI